MTAQTEISMVMAAVSVSCAVPGVFLVLRRLAMTADAIGHTLIFGIVIAFVFAQDLSSPWLTFGAAASGVLTVLLIDLLLRFPKVKQDAAIGLVFPALFAFGTILTSVEFRNIHLDIDAVLLGQVESSWLTRYQMFNRIDVPKSFAIMLGIGIVNIFLVVLFYKELKITTFDAGLAATLGFAPSFIHIALISNVSLTAVAAFDAVGPILVVAFFVIPSATANLLTHKLWLNILLSIFIAMIYSIFGTWIAYWLNTNIAGTVATILGLQFGIVAIGTSFYRRLKS